MVYNKVKANKFDSSIIAKVEEIPAGQMKGFSAGGKDILIVNYQGKFYAIGKICTHAGGDLSKGKLEGDVVTCPRHGSKFDVTTGECISGPKIGFLKLKAKNEPVFEVKIDGNTVMAKV